MLAFSHGSHLGLVNLRSDCACNTTFARLDAAANITVESCNYAPSRQYALPLFLAKVPAEVFLFRY